MMILVEKQSGECEAKGPKHTPVTHVDAENSIDLQRFAGVSSLWQNGTDSCMSRGIC